MSASTVPVGSRAVLNHLLAATAPLCDAAHGWIVANEEWTRGDRWFWGYDDRLPFAAFARAMSGAGLEERDLVSLEAYKLVVSLLRPDADVPAVIAVIEANLAQGERTSSVALGALAVALPRVVDGSPADSALRSSAALSSRWVAARKIWSRAKSAPQDVPDSPGLGVSLRPDPEAAEHLTTALLTTGRSGDIAVGMVLDLAAALLTADGMSIGRRREAAYSVTLLSGTVAAVLLPIV